FCSSIFVTQAASTNRIGVVAGEHRASAAGLYLTFYYTGAGIGAVLPGYAYAAWGWIGCVLIAVLIQAVMAGRAAGPWGGGGRAGWAWRGRWGALPPPPTTGGGGPSRSEAEDRGGGP